MKYVILLLILLLNFLLPSCSSNCCLKENEFESLPGLEVYNDIKFFEGDSINLRAYILNHIKTIDSTDWKHCIVYLKIADEMEKKGELIEISQALRYKIFTKNIGEFNSPVFNDETITKESAAKLYVSAYALFRYANTMYNMGMQSQAMMYFNQAYQFSPDRLKKYSCENIAKYLSSDHEFRSTYAKKLEERGEFDKAWNIWFELANDDDNYMKYLQLLHSKLYPEEDFDIYWANNRFSHFPTISNFEFINSEGDTTSLYSSSKNWMLIDFWHPQCYGCIEEFPRIEDFTSKVVENPSLNNKVLAISINPDWPAMLKVVEPKKYQFVTGAIFNMKPSILSAFPRIEYTPYKIIVTPDKNYFVIPVIFWQEYAGKYLLNDI